MGSCNGRRQAPLSRPSRAAEATLPRRRRRGASRLRAARADPVPAPCRGATPSRLAKAHRSPTSEASPEALERARGAPDGGARRRRGGAITRSAGCARRRSGSCAAVLQRPVLALLERRCSIIAAPRWASRRKEQFRILFLDKQNQLIADEVQQKGTVDHTPVYAREVVKRALELSAHARSCSCTTTPPATRRPSRADIEMTKQIVSSRQACSASPCMTTSSSASRAMRASAASG